MMGLALGLFLNETGRALMIDPATLNIDLVNQLALSISSKCVCLVGTETLRSLPRTVS